MKTKSRCVDTVGEGRVGPTGILWLVQTLPCVEQGTSGKLPYKSGSSAQCSVMAERGGGRPKGAGIYIYIYTYS